MPSSSVRQSGWRCTPIRPHPFEGVGNCALACQESTQRANCLVGTKQTGQCCSKEPGPKRNRVLWSRPRHPAAPRHGPLFAVRITLSRDGGSGQEVRRRRPRRGGWGAEVAKASANRICQTSVRNERSRQKTRSPGGNLGSLWCAASWPSSSFSNRAELPLPR